MSESPLVEKPVEIFYVAIYKKTTFYMWFLLKYFQIFSQVDSKVSCGVQLSSFFILFIFAIET